MLWKKQAENKSQAEIMRWVDETMERARNGREPDERSGFAGNQDLVTQRSMSARDP